LLLQRRHFCECYECKCVHYSGAHDKATHTAPEHNGGDELLETLGDSAVAAVTAKVFSDVDTMVSCDAVESSVPVESPSVADASSAHTCNTSQSESAGGEIFGS